MVRLDIGLDDDIAYPGQKLAGNLLIDANKPFRANVVRLHLTGQELTTTKDGNKVIMDQREFLKLDKVLDSNRDYERDIIKYPFTFEIPSYVPPSYRGANGVIEYSLKAVIEANWMKDPTATRLVRVVPQMPGYIPPTGEFGKVLKENKDITLDLESIILRMDQAFPLRVLVQKRGRVKGIIIQLLLREEAVCGQFQLPEKRLIIYENKIPLKKEDLGKWVDYNIEKEWMLMQPFRSQLFSTNLELKVVLQVMMGSDLEIVVPLMVSGPKLLGD